MIHDQSTRCSCPGEHTREAYIAGRCARDYSKEYIARLVASAASFGQRRRGQILA